MCTHDGSRQAASGARQENATHGMSLDNFGSDYDGLIPNVIEFVNTTESALALARPRRRRSLRLLPVVPSAYIDVGNKELQSTVRAARDDQERSRCGSGWRWE